MNWIEARHCSIPPLSWSKWAPQIKVWKQYDYDEVQLGNNVKICETDMDGQQLGIN